MNEEVNIWEFMSYKIANVISKAANIKLTYDMVKATEIELREINEKYFIKLYIGIISVEEMNEVNEAIRKLLYEKCQ